MNITFKTRKLESVLNDEKKLVRYFGQDLTRYIQRRMMVLFAVQNLSQVPREKPERCHQLKGKRKDQFAVDVSKNYRIIFTPVHDPIPLKKDGGIDLTKITAIKILKVEDYH